MFETNPDDGAILLTADIFVAGAWTVVLRAWPGYGSIAAVQTIVFRTPPPLGGDNPFEDGNENGKGDGTAENPFRIYNIEQLQAIEGVVAPEAAISPEEAWKGITLFGASDEERLSRHYILANDIDAAATRGWNDGEGFDPIGKYNGHRRVPDLRFVEGHRQFRGALNGNGYVVRGLWINRPRLAGQGLFAFTNYANIVSVGIVRARVVGLHAVGVLVGYNTGTVSRSWAADSSVEGESALGGLVGIHAEDLIEESWFSGSVVGDGNSLGGAVGNIWWGKIRNSWALGSVKGGSRLGGFVGYQNYGFVDSSWSAAAVSGNAPIGGFTSNAVSMRRVYWSIEASGQTYAGLDNGRQHEMFGVGSLQAISISYWDPAIWDFGDSELGENDRNADFPVLRFVDSDWQAAGIASGLTRILGVFGDDLATLDARATTAIDDSIPAFAVLQLDTNGLAPNEGGGETSKPICDLRDGVLTAAAGYNGVTVKARAANAVLSELKLNCEFVARPLSIPSEVALSVEIIGDAVTLRRVYALSVSGLLSVWENDGAPTVSSGATIWIEAGAAAGIACGDDCGGRFGREARRRDIDLCGAIALFCDFRTGRGDGAIVGFRGDYF